MFLYEIFLEMDVQHVSSPLQDTLLTRTELELALKKAVTCYRLLKNPEKVAAYRRWLQHCEQAMQGRQEIPFLPLLIDFLVAEDSPLSHTVACEILTQIFYLNTQQQSNGLAMAQVGQAFIDRPRAFAAFLRCLCRYNIHPQQILSTYLLHDYFRYYLDTLGTKNNAIEQLYFLLRVFPETKLLAEAAQTIQSDERGFKTYALDGCVSHNNLLDVKKTTLPLRFTPEIHNLKGLHVILGSDFLAAALMQWHHQKSDPIWTDFITMLFNRSDVVREQLPILLSKLHENAAMQQSLAEILDAATLNHLITQKNGDILCLIPFCPQIITILQHQDLTNYLKNIKQRSSGLSLIIGLLALFESVMHADEAMAKLVFNTLIDAVLEEPYVLEDETILRKIRRFSMANNCIMQKVSALEAALDSIINSQMQSPIEALDYITVEDVWRKVTMQIRDLQEIVTFNSTCPTDKYGLYARLALAFHMQQRATFNLNTISNALHVTPIFSLTEVTPYERLIIELLAVIDDEAFRSDCIALLDEQVVTRSWRTCLYGDQPFFQRAINAANLGLIQWLDHEQIKPTITYDALAIEAARRNNWAIVFYFHSHYPLKTITTNVLLHMAVMQGVADAISLLWSGNNGKSPTAKQIAQTFMLAVRKMDTESVRNMILHLKTPLDSVMTQGFKLAIKSNDPNTATAIAMYKKGKFLIAATEEALVNAAATNQCELLRRLIPLCRLTIIENAFLIAARANHLQAIDLFLEFPTCSPRGYVIKRAWNEAKQHKRSAIVICLTKLCIEDQQAPQPSPLKRAVSCNIIPNTTAMEQHGFFALTRGASLKQLHADDSPRQHL
jgi:hypothetical protein